MHLKEMLMLEGATLKGNIIENVKVCGLVSKNGYSYPAAVLEAARPMYENADVFANHKEQRLIEDKIGFLKGVEMRADGLWAKEMVLNEKHPIFEQVKWWADNAPSKLGMSHSVDGKMSESGKSVEAITGVESVDLVARPATVAGLRESVQTTEKIGLDKLLDGAYAIATSALKDKVLSESEKIKRLVSIHTELIEELQPKTSKEVTDMAIEWDKIKLEDLEKNLPAVVEAIRKSGAADEKRVQEALAKVPEKARSALFESQVRSAKDQAATDALVADRLEVSKDAVETATKKTEIKKEEKQEETDEAKIVEAARKRAGLV